MYRSASACLNMMTCNLQLGPLNLVLKPSSLCGQSFFQIKCFHICVCVVRDIGEELWSFWSYEIHSPGRSRHDTVRRSVGRQQCPQHQVPFTDQRRDETELWTADGQETQMIEQHMTTVDGVIDNWCVVLTHAVPVLDCAAPYLALCCLWSYNHVTGQKCVY